MTYTVVYLARTLKENVFFLTLLDQIESTLSPKVVNSNELKSETQEKDI